MTRKLAKYSLLAALAILIGALAMRSKTQMATLNVIMTDYKFTPDHLTFQHDVHYRLHLENHGKEAHEFTAPLFFAFADIDNPDVLNRERTEILMQPGDKKDVFLTAHRPGIFDLRCADHDWYGMVGGISVE